MKKLLKELLWFIGFYIVLVTIKNILFPLEHLKYYKLIFLNVEESNFFITNTDVFISILIIGYFIIYQIRTFILKYKNPFSNYILIFWHILLIGITSIFISFAFSIENSIALANDQTFYINDVPSNFNWQLIFYSLLLAQLVIAGLLFYNAIRIAKVKLIP